MDEPLRRVVRNTARIKETIRERFTDLQAGNVLSELFVRRHGGVHAFFAFFPTAPGETSPCSSMNTARRPARNVRRYYDPAANRLHLVANNTVCV